MADNLFAFDEASAKKIIEQIRFLETRVRNLQTQIGQFRSYGVVRHGDRGVSQDTIILVRLKDNERLHNADLSKVPQREREPTLIRFLHWQMWLGSIAKAVFTNVATKINTRRMLRLASRKFALE